MRPAVKMTIHPTLINSKTAMVKTIGTNAGLIWNALDKLGKMDTKALKKATKLRTDKELYAAIGWLAKEGKLHFEEREGELYLDLIY